MKKEQKRNVNNKCFDSKGLEHCPKRVARREHSGVLCTFGIVDAHRADQEREKEWERVGTRVRTRFSVPLSVIGKTKGLFSIEKES